MQIFVERCDEINSVQSCYQISYIFSAENVISITQYNAYMHRHKNKIASME